MWVCVTMAAYKNLWTAAFQFRCHCWNKLTNTSLPSTNPASCKSAKPSLLPVNTKMPVCSNLRLQTLKRSFMRNTDADGMDGLDTGCVWVEDTIGFGSWMSTQCLQNKVFISMTSSSQSVFQMSPLIVHLALGYLITYRNTSLFKGLSTYEWCMT